MRKYVLIVALLGVLSSVSAQQLPDSHFENWGDKFNGDKQLTEWHGSNVNQAGFKFTFMYQKPGRTGFSAYVTDCAVGIPKLGIGAIGPGYLSLGTPWQYLKGLNVNGATAGTEGGIAWKYRPDTMAVWVKRVGPAPEKEDFHRFIMHGPALRKERRIRIRKAVALPRSASTKRAISVRRPTATSVP